MKKSMIAILILISTTLFAQAGIKNEFGKDLITRDDIEHSGISRLSDIFTLINSASSYTLDGYRWDAKINSLSAGWDQNWLLMVDGQKMSLNYPFAANLNLLPFSISHIDSIVVYTIPQVHNGEFTEKGLVHIYLEKNIKGFYFGGSFATGNEVGDPGPYNYIYDNTENIDQVGPYYSMNFGYGHPDFGLDIKLKHHMHITTDPVINNRLNDFPWEYKELRLLSGSIKIEFGNESNTHTITAGHSVTGDTFGFSSYGSDLIFFKPVGSELPVSTIYSYAGANGFFDVSSLMKINYRANFSSSLIDTVRYFEKPPFDWNINHYDIMIELEKLGFKSTSKFSLGYERNELKTGYVLEKDFSHYFKILGEYQYIFSKYFTQTYFGGAYFDIGKSALKLGMLSRIRFNSKVNLKVNTTYSTRLPEEDNSIWYWAIKGYNYLESTGVNYSISSELYNSRALNIDADILINTLRKTSVVLGVFYRGFWDQPAVRYDYLYDLESNSFSSNTSITHVNDNIAGFKLKVDSRIIPNIKMNLFYQFAPGVDGDLEFYSNRESFPTHKLRFAADYNPVPEFSVRGALTYLSETAWFEYEGIYESSGGLYNCTVEEKWLLDLAFQKYLWNNRLRINLLFQNILGQLHTYHPLGAISDFTVFMQVELKIN